MKQRILALFLALCLCLPLAACGKKQGYDPLEGVQTRVVTDSAGRLRIEVFDSLSGCLEIIVLLHGQVTGTTVIILDCIYGDTVRINPSFDNSRNFHY